MIKIVEFIDAKIPQLSKSEKKELEKNDIFINSENWGYDELDPVEYTFTIEKDSMDELNSAKEFLNSYFDVEI